MQKAVRTNHQRRITNKHLTLLPWSVRVTQTSHMSPVTLIYWLRENIRGHNGASGAPLLDSPRGNRKKQMVDHEPSHEHFGKENETWNLKVPSQLRSFWAFQGLPAQDPSRDQA